MNSGIFIVGLVILIAGIFAAGYAETVTGSYFFGAVTNTSSTHPYGAFGIPLVVLGILVMLAGALMPEVVTTKETTAIEVPQKKHTKVVVKEN